LTRSCRKNLLPVAVVAVAVAAVDIAAAGIAAVAVAAVGIVAVAAGIAAVAVAEVPRLLYFLSQAGRCAVHLPPAHTAYIEDQTGSSADPHSIQSESVQTKAS
jgi:streptogramin lyase